MYIALEGIDTCGKSTQIALLKQAYPDAIFTKEPGGTPIGKEIREMILKENKAIEKRPVEQHSQHPHNVWQCQHCYDKANAMDSKTEFLLFLADRAEHTAKVIIPNQNSLIFSDRSIISGIAYAKKIPQAKVLNLFATGGIVPDLVIVLKIDPATLTSRLSQKSNDAIEQRGIPYLLGIQEAIKSTTKELGCELALINANQSKACIHAQIKQIIDSKL
ncbi:dTMP kinase [Helicobacter sp. 11S02596-1]|uniref:dTMP kinase n=1 Tax=Helicobacter sp. 11S02596-1 TaxID=1476194 RepID=UPI000BA77A6D|nr:dTMP kinase [Helicobacter sp. 11S02596-1]PAF42474.1 hypothetical protein BJI48_06650 [Helicobacter sp. 11S02596-1]